jgi:hypothetical protein
MTDKEIKEVFFKMTRTPDGRVLYGYQNLDEAVSRYKYFREWLKKEIPDFTEEEIIKYYKKNNQLKKLFEWSGHEEFLKVLEIYKNKD